MSLTWTTLDELARKPAYGQLTGHLIALGDDERQALAAELEAAVKRTRSEDWWSGGSQRDAGYALAALACMPSAARAAAVLTRRGMRDAWDEVPLPCVRRIVEARGISWLPDLGVRLAGRLPARDSWSDPWRFVAAMLEGTPHLAPRSESFVRGWLSHLQFREGRRRPLADAVRSSPFLDVLFPAVFEVGGLGGGLLDGFPALVGQLVAEGRFDRAQIYAATLDRLIRGDRPAMLRPFTQLHDVLAPTADEMAEHAGDYARLLAEAPSALAGIAQRALRSVDDAGRLELETLLDVSAATLLRSEKILVKAQLSWLDRVVRRQPDRAGEVLETVAVAFGHPTLDVQERALTLIERHRARLDDDTAARLADVAATLSGDLPARAAGLFGVAVPAPDAPVPGAPAVATLAPPAPSAAMPPPITDATELAAEIVALLHEETAVGWERVLAALVALPAAGVPVAGTLRPVLDRHNELRPEAGSHGRWLRSTLLGNAMRAAIRATTKPAGAGEQSLPETLRDTWLFGSGKRKSLRGGPGKVLDLRIREVGDRFAARPVIALLATPTRVNGTLDAEVLLDRLARAEREGWHPWPIDLEQALLRVPRHTGTDVVTRAAELTSPAGRQFAAWLTDGGLPDPVSTRFEQIGRSGRQAYGGWPRLLRRVVVNLDQARGGGEGTLVEDLLVNLSRSDAPVYYPDDFSAPADITVAVLPQHREVTAAWVLPVLASLADVDERGGSEALPLLAECSGPIGPAMTLALAYVLGARHDTDRLAAVDAFLLLAADPALAGSPPGSRDDVAGSEAGGRDLAGLSLGARVGAEVGSLCADGTVKLTRVVPALTEIHRGGAGAQLWDLLVTALPALLPHGTRGLPDLLELATRVAGEVGARDDIPGLTEAAAKPGSGRLTKEARRLRSVLTA
ncbi:DUF6493 family protein [Actinoplanes sp. DH11]|uniref:DUF6493 family protein n=1 Tax=Actinoplanes sp. DH11 TaxID=2857011 RepID=UPI001E3F1078|nr:DUF6493 family protein [Actinoplanes sp. DH11]